MDFVKKTKYYRTLNLGYKIMHLILFTLVFLFVCIDGIYIYICLKFCE